MRVAVVGSRNLSVSNLKDYLPKDTTEIISGGAHGVDASAKAYALANGIHLTEFLPNYARYGRAAPLKRNLLIIEHADYVLAFWDRESHGTKYVIDRCREQGIPHTVILMHRKNP